MPTVVQRNSDPLPGGVAHIQPGVTHAGQQERGPEPGKRFSRLICPLNLRVPGDDTLVVFSDLAVPGMASGQCGTVTAA